MKTKRLLSLALSIVMIFSLFPHAFAMEDLAALYAQQLEEARKQADAVQAQAADLMEGYNHAVSEAISIVDELQKAGHANPLECEHKHQKTETQEILAPTCTTPGSHLEVTSCEDCTLVLSQEIVEDPAAHDYIGEETVPATETEEGEMTYTCSRCGDTYTEPIPALNEEDKEEEETEENEEDEEPVPFDQSKTVSGVTVRVSAPAGVFPAKSELLVDAVPDEEVDPVVEGEREEDEEVVSCYTFDIRVVDENGDELQPKDAQSVTVSFTLSEAADDTLETNVYHISEGDGGALEAEKLATTGSGSTVTAETGSFSLYRVETVRAASSEPTRGEPAHVSTLEQLQAALNADGTEIVLDANIDIKGEVTLDLKGKNISCPATGVIVYGELTLMDSVGGGEVNYLAFQKSDSTLDIYGGKVVSLVVNKSPVNINIYGGSIVNWHTYDNIVTINYGVTCAAAQNGTVKASAKNVDPASGIAVPANTTVTITATPSSSSYVLDTLTYTRDGGSAQTITTTLTERVYTGSFTMPTAPVTVTATFVEKQKIPLTITANPQAYVYNGQTQGEGDTAYEDPEKIAEKFTVVGLQGSDAIKSIILDGQGKEFGEYELVPSKAAIGEATGNYDIKYVSGTLTITPNITYSVEPDSSGTVEVVFLDNIKEYPAGADEGENIKVKAVAGNGYVFSEWTSSDVTLSNPSGEEATFTVPAVANPSGEGSLAGKVQVTAKFTPVDYTITFDTAGGEAIDPMPYTVESTDKLPTLTKAGSAFSGWKVTKAGGSWKTDDVFSAETSLTGKYGDVTLTAQWSMNDYTIKVTADPAAGGDATADMYSANLGSTITLTAAPKEGYRFVSWSATPDTVTVGTDGKFTMPASDVEVTAKFELIPMYTVIWLDGDDKELDSKTYKEGEPEPTTDRVPTKAEDDKYTYEFSKWDDGKVSGTTKTYKPIFNAKEKPVVKPDYYFENGDTPVSWVAGTSRSVKFVVHRIPNDSQAFSHFLGVQVSGGVLSPRAYTAAPGSVEITLLPAYTRSLPAGSYKLKADFDDGSAETVFVVLDSYSGGTYYSSSTSERYTYVPPSNNPRTGDDSHLALWGALACLSAAGAVLMAKKRKRREH